MNIIHSCSKLGGDKLDGDKRPHKGLVPEFASAPTNNLAIQAAGKNTFSTLVALHSTLVNQKKYKQVLFFYKQSWFFSEKNWKQVKKQ